jgi:hypothetical protein
MAYSAISDERGGQRVQTSLFIHTGPPAVAAERSAPLHAVAGILLDHQLAAPIAAEAGVEVEDPRWILAVDRLESLQLHHELRHHDRLIPFPQQRDLWVPLRVRGVRRCGHDDVRAQREPARQLYRPPPLPEFVAVKDDRVRALAAPFVAGRILCGRLESLQVGERAGAGGRSLGGGFEKRAGAGGVEVAKVEAGDDPRQPVAPPRLHLRHQGVPVRVVLQRQHRLTVPRRLRGSPRAPGQGPRHEDGRAEEEHEQRVPEEERHGALDHAAAARPPHCGRGQRLWREP